MTSPNPHPYTQALCGASALHFSAEIGNVEIVRCLLAHGARMEENEHGMTPLKVTQYSTAFITMSLINHQSSTINRQSSLHLRPRQSGARR